MNKKVTVDQLDERYVAEKDRFDLIVAVPTNNPNARAEDEGEDYVPVWQKGASRPDGTIHQLIVSAESPEVVRERLSRLGYHPDKFLNDDQEYYPDGYAPGGS